MTIMLPQEVFNILTGKQGKLVSKCDDWKKSLLKIWREKDLESVSVLTMQAKTVL